MGKENPEEITSILPKWGCFVGDSTLIWYHKDYRGTHGNEPLGMWLWWRRVGGACNNHHMDLGRWTLYLQCPSSHPNPQLYSSVHPSQVRSGQGLQWEAQLPDLGAQMRSFTGSRAGCAHTQARCCITVPTHCGEWLHAPLDQDRWWQLEACSLLGQELREERQSRQSAKQTQQLCLARELGVKISSSSNNKQNRTEHKNS